MDLIKIKHIIINVIIDKMAPTDFLECRRQF